MDYGDQPANPDNNVVKDVPPRMFWAFNYRTSGYYQITANLFVDGKHCRIWVEQGANVSSETAESVAHFFDNAIYPRMMDTFAIYGNMAVDGQIVARDTMQLADWLGDGDGKLAILRLDIQDYYQRGVNESRTAGYFSSSDLLASLPHSNCADILYIDVNPERPGSLESNKTIAHEMQHLMNYVTSALLRRDDTFHEMDTWINEGLSAIAEWIYSEQHSEDRWVYYNADPSGLIQKGNNFFVWGNHKNEHNYAELDDYATVYLFFHWLRLQTHSNNIFRELISSKEYNYRAVTQAVSKELPGAGYDDWGTLLKTWLAANYINAPSGPYGYRNDITLKKIKAKTIPAGTQSVRLYPGEGVYSLTKTGFSWPDEGINIKYAGLTDITPWLNGTGTFNGGALLTYNANTNEYGRAEEGKTSGIASNIDTTLYEQRITDLLSRRTVIDGGGVLRQNSYAETPGLAVTEAVTVPVLGIIKLE
jgi:hypothetical protein